LPPPKLKWDNELPFGTPSFRVVPLLPALSERVRNPETSEVVLLLAGKIELPAAGHGLKSRILDRKGASPKGAAGLMQLRAPTAATFGVTNRLRFEENIRGGVAYLAHLIRVFEGERRVVAAAYYAGQKLIKKHGLAYADPAVYRYVSQVQSLYRNRQMAAR
jgi:hypothetical protein